MENRATKQRVHIEGKATSSNRTRLYLVWLQDKKRIWESTKEFYFTNAKGAFEKQHNKDVKLKVEATRNQRESQLFKGEIEEIIEQKALKNKDFTSYFEQYVSKYSQKDIKVMRAVFNHFKAFAPPHITAKEITEKFCIDFKDFLAERLNGESAPSYFARFKKMLRQATKDKLFRTFPAQDVVNKKTDISLTKEVLNINEIEALANAHCGNDEVKRAFLFACNSGLRFVDIKALQWKHIENNTLTIKQAKTKESASNSGIVIVSLNNTALKILGTPDSNKEEFVFKLPSHNATIKNLNHWAKRAGVEKHLTFHCARHTFGTLLAYYKTDIKTISELLGHTSLKYTSLYVRVSNEMKERAVNAIPEINF